MRLESQADSQESKLDLRFFELVLKSLVPGSQAFVLLAGLGEVGLHVPDVLLVHFLKR